MNTGIYSRIFSGKEPSAYLLRRAFLAMAAVMLFYSFCTVTPAQSQEPVCPPGEADLSAAMAYGDAWLGKPYAIGGGHPSPPNPSPDAGYLGCNASTSGDPGWEFCRPGVPSYDCSGLAGAVAAQISGYTGGTRLARDMLTLSSSGTAIKGTHPVYFSFSRLNEYGPMKPGHIWITVCGKTFNSANYSVGIVSLESTPPLVRRIPRGLAGLTMASCSKACSPGCDGDSCDFEGGDPDPSSGSGCETLTGYLDEWWDDEFLPALKDMTAQLYAYRIFQTKQLGSMMDAEYINRAARLVQEQRVTALQENLPNEKTCIAGSYTTAIAETARTATALTQGLKKDLGLRANNATVAEASGPNPRTDRRMRWEEYCTEFHDPEGNNGVSTCPSPDTPGLLVNGDISIEGFLLKDTINMTNPSEYKASLALLKNLVQPIIMQKIPEAVVETTTGKEYIIRQQHLDSINNIARDVVASMISRRSNASPTATAPVAALVREIRLKAGVDPARISANPSYNEIMQALTKERFFDPDYFIRMHNNLGAIKQEQTAIDAYITVQLQDIYRMQEQLNALMAARAALKIKSDKNDSLERLAPK